MDTGTEVYSNTTGYGSYCVEIKRFPKTTSFATLRVLLHGQQIVSDSLKEKAVQYYMDRVSLKSHNADLRNRCKHFTVHIRDIEDLVDRHDLLKDCINSTWSKEIVVDARWLELQGGNFRHLLAETQHYYYEIRYSGT